jgi:hypothetical protein
MDNRVLATAPYSFYLYERLISTWTDLKTNIVLRHDLDAWPENVWRFTDIEKRYHIRSFIFVRMDGEAYPPESLKRIIHDLYKDQFLIGIHHSEYSRSSYFKEVDLFEDLYGFYPFFATTHGYPCSRLTQWKRRYFIWQMRKTGSFDLENNYSKRWPHVFSDGYKKGTETYMINEIDRIANYKEQVMFVTHPEYWI